MVLDSILNEKKYGLELRPESDDDAKPFVEEDKFKEGVEGVPYSESDIDQWGMQKDKKEFLRKQNLSSDDEADSKELALTPEEQQIVDKKLQAHTEELDKMKEAFEATQKLWIPNYEVDNQRKESPLREEAEFPEIEWKKLGEPNLKRSMQNHEDIDQVFKDF